MEYRSLFETDTETILNELTSLEQQQQQQPAHTAASGTGASGGGSSMVVNANGTHMQSSYSSQIPAYQQQQHATAPQAQGSYVMQQQQPSQAQQQQYYGNANPSSMMMQQQKPPGYMNSAMPGQQTNQFNAPASSMLPQQQQQQHNNGLMNSWSSGPSAAGAPGNQVPGAYQNQTTQQQQGYKPAPNANMIMSQPQQAPMIYKMSNQYAPNSNSPKPSSVYQQAAPPGLGAPNTQQQQQLMMNQSQQPPMIMKQQPMAMGQQFVAPGSTTLNNNNASTNQTVNMTSSLPQQHSSYYPSPQGQQQQQQQQSATGPKQLSSLPPHMQQQQPQQYNPSPMYNSTSPSPQMSPQPRPMMPNQPMQPQQAYQPSPNKLPSQTGPPNMNVPPGAAGPANPGMVPPSAIHHHMSQQNAPGQQLSPNRTPMPNQPYYPNAPSNYGQQTTMYSQAPNQYQQPHANAYNNYTSNSQGPNAGPNVPYSANSSTNSYYNSTQPAAQPTVNTASSYSSMDVDQILTANITTSSSAPSAISPSASSTSNGDSATAGQTKTGRGKGGKAAKGNAATVNDGSDMLNTSSDESFNAGTGKAKGKRGPSKKKAAQEQASAASIDASVSSPVGQAPSASMYQPGQPGHGMMANHSQSSVPSPVSNRPPANMAALTIQRHDLTNSTQPSLSPNNSTVGQQAYPQNVGPMPPPPSMGPPQQGQSMPVTNTGYLPPNQQPGQMVGPNSGAYHPHMSNYANGGQMVNMSGQQGMHPPGSQPPHMNQMPMINNGQTYATNQQPQQFMKKPDGTPADPSLLYSTNSSLQQMKQMGVPSAGAPHGPPMGMMTGSPAAGPNGMPNPQMIMNNASGQQPNQAMGQAPNQGGGYMVGPGGVKPAMSHQFQQPYPQQSPAQAAGMAPMSGEMSGVNQQQSHPHMHHPPGQAPGAPMSGSYPLSNQPQQQQQYPHQAPHYPGMPHQQPGMMPANVMTNGMPPQQQQAAYVMGPNQMVSPYPQSNDPNKMQAPPGVYPSSASLHPPPAPPQLTPADPSVHVNTTATAIAETNKSPKKLTKKQQQMLAAGEIDANGVLTSPNKKSPRSKSAKKAGSLDNSMSSSSSMTDLAAGQMTNGGAYNVSQDAKPLNESDINAIDAKGQADGSLSASTHARIDATIDDFMKQYKKKKKSKSKKGGKAAGDLSGDDENGKRADASDDDSDKDESFRENGDEDASDEDEENEDKEDGDNESPVKKTKARKPRVNKKKKDATDLDSTDAGVLDDATASGKKKRRAPAKKSKLMSNLLLDDQQSMLTGGDSSDMAGMTTVRLDNIGGEDSLSMTPSGEAPSKKRGPKAKAVTIDPDTPSDVLPPPSAPPGMAPIITTPSNRGRRKSTQHLAKLFQKKQKKKRKRTSSGEDEGEEDDSADDFELSCSTAAALGKASAKRTVTEQANTAAAAAAAACSDEGTGSQANGEMVEGADPASDEATAKMLQASENKRRSTRTTAAKRTKYNDEEYKLKDEDLLMPLTEAEIAAEAAAAAAAENGANIVLSTPDSFVVDKILGMRLFKRKTLRKKEKKPKEQETKEPAVAEAAPTNPDTETKNVEEETKTATTTVTAEEPTTAAKPASPSEAAATATAEAPKETVVEMKPEKASEDQPAADQPPVESEEPVKMEESTAPETEADKEVKQESEAKETEDTKMEVDTKASEPPLEEASTAPAAEGETPTTTTTTTEEKPAVETKTEEEAPKEPGSPAKETTAESTTSEAKPEAQPEPAPAPVAAAAAEEEEEDEDSEYEEDGGEVEVEEFYVKYKNYSYLHCEWRSRDELFTSDKRVDQKIKRYKLKKTQSMQMVFDWCDDENANSLYNNDYDELFNPDYVEIDRILDTYEMEDAIGGANKVRYFLIKWKSLPYDEASWEVEADVKNKKKIDQFFAINTFNADVHLKVVPRPKPERWRPVDPKQVYKNGNTLREYQIEGISWLAFCWLNGRNCILADEMGLGKTVQSVTFLHEMASHGVRGPYLVLVPLSTIGNWNREFETWTDFNVIVYHGSTASRQLLQDYEFYFKPEALKGETKQKNVVKFNALITTYEVLLSDVQLFCQFKWRSCIIDEAHRLKNKNCKLMEGLRYMDVEHKVLLTGTPLQNNVEELFSLLHFLEPQQFNSSVEFMQDFGDLKTDTQVTKLQAVLKPMMLRRLKEDVEKNLAPKEETIVEVELTNTQKKYYRAILEKNFQFLAKGTTAANMPNLMNTMMELRKCCNHPYLINGAEDNIVNEFMDRMKQKTEAERAADPDGNLGLKAMVQASGKLVLVDKLLPKLKAGGHKVLIFSQMIRVLDILEDYLIQMRFTYERLDGRVRGEMRQEAIDRYSKPDSDRFAFLLCTRAGGLGINLTAADTVIIYDSDWNPQNDLQAQARCHRIGQRKSVKIYRLITRNTYEREMFDRASLKLGLDKAILQSMRNEQGQAAATNQQMQLSKKEIEDLLKKGAYGAIMEDDNAGDKFCEEDIDKILQQRSTVIQIEGGEKGSTFSKASFQTSETNDISIDDPEFWQKWAKKADVDVEEKMNPKDERIIYEPRRRTQTRRFGGPDDILESDYSSSDDENKENGGAAGATTGKDGKGKRGRRGKKRAGEDANGDSDFVAEGGHGGGGEEESEQAPLFWSRDECYKVEKNLMVFGWQRWSKILKHCAFSQRKKGGIHSEQDVESLARTILAYAVKNYHGGDDTIKQFFVELIDPSKSEFPELRSGLSGPKPRGPVASGRGKGRKSAAASAAAATASNAAANPTIATIAESANETEETKKEATSAEDPEVKAKTESTEPKTEEEPKEDKKESQEGKTEPQDEKKEPQDETKEPAVFQVPEVPANDGGATTEQTTATNSGDELEWAKNVEEMLADENYKKHLLRQSTKILQRIKMIYYIKHDILGDELAKKIDEFDAVAEEALLNAINNGEDAAQEQQPSPDNFLSDEAFQMPEVYADLPVEWWTHQCDKSLILGVYRHGYERYYQIRLDPKLCFLEKCGLPDANLQMEEGADDQEGGKQEKDETAMEVDDSNAAKDKEKDNEDKEKEAAADEKATNKKGQQAAAAAAAVLKFPSVSELNNRLRRLITAVQKLKKQNEIASKRELERQEKRLSKLASTQERAVMRQIEKQNKWSRREEQNFYRAISSFGVDCLDKTSHLYAWERFKEIGQLDKKLDDTLTDYFNVFYAMCKRVCHKPSLGEFEEPLVSSVNGSELPQVETISEERASRCLQRIDLLNKVRQDVLRSANFEEWIGSKCMSSPDLPDWWISGKHDKELIKAAARYGIIRTEFYYVNDSEFTFKDYLAKYMRHIDELILNDHRQALAAGTDLSAIGTIDPIQYYFQNQAKIQMTFKETLNKDSDAPKPPLISKLDEIGQDADRETLVCKEVIIYILDQIDTEQEKFKDVKLPPSCFFSSLASGLGEANQQITSIPMILWPKDRVLVNRLEAIIQMFENNGQWPVQRSMVMMPQAPFGSSNDLLSEQRKMMMSPMLGYDNMDDLDIENQDSNDRDDVNDSMMMMNESSSKYQKPKRGRPPKLGELPQMALSGSSATASPSDPSHKIRNILNSSAEPRNSRNNRSSMLNGMDLDDNNKMEESLLKAKAFLEPGEVSRAKSTRASRGGAGGAMTAAMLAQQELEQYENGLSSGSSNKRMRKPVAKDMPQAASGGPLSPSQIADSQSAAAAAVIASLFSGPNKDPEERIPMFNIENGTRLTGNKAPKRADLPMWIMSHPNYVPDQEEFLQLAFNNANQFNMDNTAAAAATQSEVHQTRSKRGMPPPPQQQPPSNGANKNKGNKQRIDDEDEDYEDAYMDAYEQQQQSRKSVQPDKRDSINATDRLRRQQQHSPSPARSNKPSAELPSPGSSNQSSNAPAPVVLVNKTNGKKISGAKVPSWKSLPGFLERNEQIYIDPSSSDQVRARFNKQNMPEIIRSRLIVLPTKSSSSSSATNNSSKPLPSKNSERGNNSSANSSQQPQQAKPSSSQQQPREQSKGPSSNSSGQSNRNSNGPSASNAKANNNNNNGSNSGSKNPSQAPIPQGLFDPFSPNSAAALQMPGFSELLAAAGGSGSIDPLSLSGFMTALAAQSGNPSSFGAGAGAFNPFMFSPFNGAGAPGAASAASNFQQPSFADLLKDLGAGKIPPGFDMSSFDDLAAMATAAGMGAPPQLKSDSPSMEQMKASKIPTSQSSKDSNQKSHQQQQSGNKDGSRVGNDGKNKPQPHGNNNNNSQSSRDARDNRDAKNGRPNQPSSNSSNNSSSKIPGPSSSGSKNNYQPSSKDGKGAAPSSSGNKKPNEGNQSRPQSSSSASASAGKERPPAMNESVAAAAALAGLDPATYASMMDQDKFMQDLLNLSQFSQLGMSNPFNSLFGAGGAAGAAGLFMPPPMLPPSNNNNNTPSSSNKKSSNNSKSSNRASPSHQASPSRERSVSPASSIASNISQQQQQQQAPADFNMFMNNFLNYPSLMGAGGAGGLPSSLMPPSMMPGLDASSMGMMAGGMGDLSKLPMELLAALSAGGGAGLDPAMLSALMGGFGGAQEDNVNHAPQSSNKEQQRSKPSNQQPPSKSAQGHSSMSSKSQQHASNKPHSSGGGSNNKNAPPPSKPGSSSQRPNKPGDDQGGLDLTMKKSSSSSRNLNNIKS